LASKRACFISLEGPDGSGKSTLAKLLAGRLRRQGRKVFLTREPGGSPQAARIRKLVLGAKGFLGPAAELLLFLADRAQHVADSIRPALDKGWVVISDRYSDSTLAYQGAGRGFPLARLKELNRFATGGLSPRLTLLLDLDAPHGLRRAAKRSGRDRMERSGAAFHARVRRAFLGLAKAEPGRIKVIKVSGLSKAQVLEAAFQHVKRVL
jgi:dTMP kinase